MALEVIGAGLPRTGTLSMKAALEQLGFGPCHHMSELLSAPWRAPVWERYFREGTIDWDAVFESCGSTVDAPACFAWRALADRYPEAKVVLTVRDQDAWIQSMFNTVLSARHQTAMAGTAMEPMFQAMNAVIMRISGAPPQDGAPPAGPPPREMLVALFEGQKNAVIAGLSPERLLVFDVREGWGPLCRFLGVDEPSTPFPRVNESATFHDAFSHSPG